jgi:pimeloyl-ACP methyl ester carboxylesterase
MGQRFPGGCLTVTAAVSIRRAYVQLLHGQLHYRVAGEPHRPVLLLLHQSPSSSAMYEPMMELLADRFYLLAPDTPGFGNSDPLQVAPGSLEIADYAAALRYFLTAVDVESCFIFGHHTGAAIAVQLEHDYRATARAMALSGPTLLTSEQQRDLPQLANPFPAEENGEHLLAMWQRLRDKDSSAPLDISQRELMSAFACGEAYQASYQAVCRQDFAGLLDSVACPVLVFAGDADPLYGAVKPTAERLVQGRVAELSGGERTYVCERQAPEVAVLVANFFLEES